MMDTPICDFVKAYREKNGLRMHMPGHKGRGFLGMEEMDITEIAGRYTDIYCFTKGNVAFVYQIAPRRNVVYGLGNESAPVYRICTRESVFVVCEYLVSFRVGEYLFNTRLCIVKVTSDSAYIDV